MQPHRSNRRSFLRKSAAVAVSAPLIRSLEEYALAEQRNGTPAASGAAATPKPAASLPQGKIGKVSLSRLIAGANLINGYAHSRDLIYVSPLLKHYFTDEKILESWSLCEQHGVDTTILFPSDPHARELYKKHRASRGKLQCLCQLAPAKDDLKTSVEQAKDVGAVGAYLLGNLGDAWTREGDIKLIGELLKMIRDQGMIAGVAGHELRTVKVVEDAGLAPDFYMKTLHNTNYWSQRRPDQMKEVIDNYSIDNYWCMDPKETIAYMSELARPWIAYKVLAAGATHPRAGFKFAFENGADFMAVGMFDFQIAEDAVLARDTFAATQNRERQWCA